MSDFSTIIQIENLCSNRQWLNEQSVPVIAYGSQAESIANARENISADVVVTTLEDAENLAEKIAANPITAITLAQVLRSHESLTASQALDVESMAFATLQGGAEFAQWLERYKDSRRHAAAADQKEMGEAILMSREGDQVKAVLNRPRNRNAINVETRDAWVEMLCLLEADESIKELQISAKGACFSVGGDLEEFGTTPDTATAHWVRTVQSPARLLARHGSRVSCKLHGACIGSGVELPAFASRISASSKTFFHLPELKMGLIPGGGGTVSITRRIGRLRMAAMVFSGRRINAKTALNWGLIDAIAD